MPEPFSQQAFLPVLLKIIFKIRGLNFYVMLARSLLY